MSFRQYLYPNRAEIGREREKKIRSEFCSYSTRNREFTKNKKQKNSKD